MSFTNDCKRFAQLAQKRVLATARESVQDVVNLANSTQDQGGRMRVDTGFLRASGGAAVGRMPRGKSTNPARREYSEDDFAGTGLPLPIALAEWNLEQPLYYGWAATYARAREHKDGFMRLAAQDWDDIVRSNALQVRARITA